ncbi:hypothetical protein HNP32_003690 [Brevundimonas bullata]|uniref:Uncharacterized protein n=1 Tax=Brevundimonas bullata TaxID=13160 RepID=A0A7W7N608_9CAUL|nr:hypothetical protein [Brevundimonas bullata]MBB4799921.1 hypothetical protein [Brevundimonas bullata]MBB6384880.1 hypothetical protein [Brevundimonas bullata]
MGVEHAGQAHPLFADARHDARIGQGRQAQAAVVRMDQGAEQTHLDHVVDQVFGILIVMLQLHGDRSDLLLQPLVDGVEDGAFVFLADVGVVGHQ